MAVMYNGKKIIPAPLVNISKQYDRTDSGKKIGVRFVLTLTGTIVANMGSPASTPGVAPNWSDNFWIAADYPPCEEIDTDGRLAAILRKQEALRCLFSEDGHVFEIEPLDGSAPLTCNPTVTDIQFNDGIWIERCDYTITLEAPIIYGNAMCTSDGEDDFDDYIVSSNEEWTIEFNDVPQDATIHHTFRVSHNLAATGKLIYDTDGTIGSQPWEHAKSWVESRLGYDPTHITGGTIGISGFSAYNHIRSETIGEESGTYSVSENWILTSGSAALEDYTITTRTSTENAITTVGIEGQIIGLEVIAYPYSVTSSKYTNALAKWETVDDLLLTRAQTYSGLSNLHVLPVTTQVGKNPVTGVINYSYEYNNRPSNCIDGAAVEVITITDVGAGDVFAIIPVIGRAAGPVLQDICTVTETRRSLNIEVVMERGSYMDSCDFATWVGGKPDVSAIVTAVTPSATQVFELPATEVWVPNTGKYTYSKEWVYQ